MDESKIKTLLSIGENISIEFKRCGNGMGQDVFQTVCSFSNRFGGDILCGVLDNGEILGFSEENAQSCVKQFVKAIANPELFSPKLFITPEIIMIDGKIIIHIHVPFCSEICKFKKDIYDRVGESDVIVTSTDQLIEIGIRKQNIFTEQKLFPHATLDVLNPELIETARKLASIKNKNHPWKTLSDEELLRSAKLMDTDLETGKKCINRAGILLLGNDDIISDVCHAYRIDALLRRVNTERYDDRLTLYTNLINSYSLLIEFCQKHLPDKFFLENNQTISIRDTIVREMVSNILIHREFTSPYVSWLIIEKNRIYTENPCKATNHKELTLETYTPLSKNPIIANFFMQIGYADELGSGLRNIYHYSKLYSGQNPKVIEDNIFHCEVPLDENFSALPSFESEKSETKLLTQNQQKIMEHIKTNPSVTIPQLSKAIGVTTRSIERNLKELREQGLLESKGNGKNTIRFVK